MIPNDQVAGGSGRSKQPFAEPCQTAAINKAVEHFGRSCPIKGYGRDEGMGCPSPTWHGFEETIVADGPTTHPSEVDPESHFVEKSELFGIHLLLRFFPLLPFHDPVRTTLLGRPHRLF